MQYRCDRCRCIRSAYADDGLCMACARFSGSRIEEPRKRVVQADKSSVTGVAEVIKQYRKENGYSQEKMASILSWDQSYISRLERGERKLTDTRDLLHLASILKVEPERLGVSESAKRQFAGDPHSVLTTVRRARKLRTLGRSLQAHNELQIAAAELSAIADKLPSEESKLLEAELDLAEAWVLCELLPEEKLYQPVKRMMHAWKLVGREELDATAAYVLSTLGNQLRIAGGLEVCLPVLEKALAYREYPEDVVSTAALLGRASGTLRKRELFGRSISLARNTLEKCQENSALVNSFALSEIEARGLLQAGESDAAMKVIDARDGAGEILANPQWRIIFAITKAEILIATGAQSEAIAILSDATRAAGAIRLSHKLHRIVEVSRTAAENNPEFETLFEMASSTLENLHTRNVT